MFQFENVHLQQFSFARKYARQGWGETPKCISEHGLRQRWRRRRHQHQQWQMKIAIMYSTLHTYYIFCHWFKWECLLSSCGAGFSFSCKSHNAIINGMVSNFQALTSRLLRWTLFLERAIKNSEFKSTICMYESASAVPFDYSCSLYRTILSKIRKTKSVHLYNIYLVCDEINKMQNRRHPLHFQLLAQYVFCFLCVWIWIHSIVVFPIDMIFGVDIEYNFR